MRDYNSYRGWDDPPISFWKYFFQENPSSGDEEDLAATNKLLISSVLIIVLFFSNFELPINSRIESWSMDLPVFYYRLGNGSPCISCQAFCFLVERERQCVIKMLWFVGWIGEGNMVLEERERWVCGWLLRERKRDLGVGVGAAMCVVRNPERKKQKKDIESTLQDKNVKMR